MLHLTKLLFTYLQDGGITILFFFLAALFFYTLWKIVFLVTDTFLQKEIVVKKQLINFLLAFFTIVALLLTPTLLIGAALEKVTAYSSEAAIVKNNYRLLTADKFFSQTYLPFWFQSSSKFKVFFDAATPFLITIFTSLTLIMGTVFSLALSLNYKRFCELVASFFVYVAMSLVIWNMIPALSPMEAYRDNILHQKFPASVQLAITEYHPNPTLTSFFKRISDGHQASHNSYTTTFPSSHVAWALMALYFGYILWRPLAIILGPYFALNAFAAVFTLQHYTVDIVSGIFVGAIAIMISQLIGEYLARFPAINFSAFVQDDIRAVKEAIKNILRAEN